MKFSKGIILIAALASFSCTSSVQKDNSARKVKCEIAQSATGSLEQSSFAGKVVAATDVNLGFRIAGIINRICAADGTFIRKGEVIAMLDDRDYKLQLSATEAEYNAIKAEADRVIALYAEQSVSANDFDKATNGLQAITAKLTAHKNALADCCLRAPMDCYVVKSNFGKGEAVAAGTPVISVISAGAPEITIDIPANNYIKQSNFEGATATIALYGDTEFDLKIKSISPKGNLNQLYRMTLSVEPSERGDYPAIGMSAMVDINYKADNSNLVEIPFSAIFEKNSSSFVWVIENDTVKSRNVEVLKIKSGGEACIKEGLSAGENVVVAGVNSLKEGQKVSILAKPSASNIGEIK